MKRRMFLAAVIVLGISFAGIAQTSPEDKAIDFSLKSIKGEQVSLKSFRNKKTVMIVFWASWCGYCIEEIPELKKLYDAVDKNKFEILAVNVQEKQQDVSAYAKKRGIKYKILLDTDGTVSAAYKVTGIPANIIVDKNGNIIYNEHQVPHDSIQYVKKLIGQKTKGSK
ncbi:MAG: TlpA disulfide reductase family protein [Elusimicrobiota bacterium]|nr:TlpA family protein disulfide reductase [Elusimicrobiota bacterium]